MGCNYVSMLNVPNSGTNVLISTEIFHKLHWKHIHYTCIPWNIQLIYTVFCFICSLVLIQVTRVLQFLHWQSANCTIKIILGNPHVCLWWMIRKLLNGVMDILRVNGIMITHYQRRQQNFAAPELRKGNSWQFEIWSAYTTGLYLNDTLLRIFLYHLH